MFDFGSVPHLLETRRGRLMVIGWFAFMTIGLVLCPFPKK